MDNGQDENESQESRAGFPVAVHSLEDGQPDGLEQDTGGQYRYAQAGGRGTLMTAGQTSRRTH